MKTWSQAWKSAAKDWRRIAVRRGIKRRTQPERDRQMEALLFTLRTLCIHSRRLINAIGAHDQKGTDTAAHLLDNAVKSAWNVMGDYDLPWDE